MIEIEIKDLIEAFDKALIIDIDHKSVWFINNGKLKVYPKNKYYELLSKINLEVL